MSRGDGLRIPSSTSGVTYIEDSLTPPWAKKKKKSAETSTSISETPPWLLNRSSNKATPKIEQNDTFENSKEIIKRNVPQETTPEDIVLENVREVDIKIEEEDNISRIRYNNLGLEEDVKGRVIVYIKSRSVPGYLHDTVGYGVFFSPLHPCNQSITSKYHNLLCGIGEAACTAIEIAANYNVDSLAICTDSQDFLNLLFKPDIPKDESFKTVYMNLMHKIQKMDRVVFVLNNKERNIKYNNEVLHLANMAAGVKSISPLTSSHLHTCDNEVLEVGDIVSKRCEELDVDEDGHEEVMFKDLYEIVFITTDPSLYHLKSLALHSNESCMVLKDELHLVKSSSNDE